MLIAPRRNLPLALVRGAFAKRGKDFTPYAVSIRCVRPCQSSATVALHLLNSGAARLRIVINRGEYFIPFVLLLRALREAPISDKQLYERLTAGDPDDAFVAENLERWQVALVIWGASQHPPGLRSRWRWCTSTWL